MNKFKREDWDEDAIMRALESWELVPFPYVYEMVLAKNEEILRLERENLGLRSLILEKLNTPGGDPPLWAKRARERVG